MKRHIRILTLVLCLTGVLVGCRGNLFHSDYATLPGAQWDGREPILFDLPVVDEPWEGTLWVSVRTAGVFDYEQVVVRAEVSCDGHRVADHLMTVNMQHSENVNKPATPYQESFSQLQPLRLEAGKHYTLRLTHRMRLNPLDHIAFVCYGLQDGDGESHK